jgi:DNA polymerase-3 subunit epsilon
VTRIHGITDQMVANAPSFAQVYPQLVEAIGRRTLIIYNAPFDCRILQYCCALHQLDPVWGYDVQRQLVTLPAHQPIQCAMRHYSQYCAERSGYRGYPRWQKLPNAGHRARSDCQAVLQILQKMANSLELL